jgi:8-oxo-dGTP pyrophosphatase MutT (NUDIX family)
MVTSTEQLTAAGSLFVSDACAAIIRVGSNGHLMQLRDSRPDIWYPGYWSLFGGGIEPGEDPLKALRRELREELGLEFAAAEFFVRTDFRVADEIHFHRSCYVISIGRETEARLVLHEGAGKRVFTGNELLSEPKVAPYDAFALYLYLHRARLRWPRRSVAPRTPVAGLEAIGPPRLQPEQKDR